MTGQSAQAQPNIALIKYWGKSEISSNLPAVDSLSLTLDSLHTQMSVSLRDDLNTDRLEINGAPATAMLPRVSACLDTVCGKDRARASIKSSSNFPIAAGLASSASAFAALVVAADRACGGGRDRLTLARIAGRASGSAARSLYGGIVTLNKVGAEINLQEIAQPNEWPLSVVIAVTEEGPKSVSSGEAMVRSAETSPFYSTWIDRQGEDLDSAMTAVAERNFSALATVAEHNCLKMHSVTWTSRPPVVYWKSATIACLETVRRLQSDGCPVFFTIDAGPQVKAVCLPEVLSTVENALGNTTGVKRTIVSGLGSGARALD